MICHHSHLPIFATTHYFSLLRSGAEARIITVTQLHEFWVHIADGSFRPSIPTSLIRDPVLHFVHRILACTVVGRFMGIEKVSQLELLILYCFVTQRPANLASIMLASLARQRGRGEGSRIAMGPYITRLAQSLDVFPRYPREGMTRGDIARHFRYEDMQQMGVCPFEGPRRFLEVRPVQLVEPPAGVDPAAAPPIGAPPPRQPRTDAREQAQARAVDPGPPCWVKIYVV